MSVFMREAMDAVEGSMRRALTYAHAYAFARASGYNPWEATHAAQSSSKGVPETIQNHVRGIIEDHVTKRQEAEVVR